MFTGIVDRKAPLLSLTPRGDACALRIRTGYTDLQLGESVAVNGVCLTVTESTHDGEALFYVSPETLARTQLGRLPAGASVNLERALRAGDRLSGHWVQGHVDGVGRVKRVRYLEEATELTVTLPPSLHRYCVTKGSVTLQGVSLTINATGFVDDVEPEIQLLIIPHTASVTTLSELVPGDSVNIEVDVLAKLVENACQPYLAHLKS